MILWTKKHLSQCNSQTNGPLHKQEWAIQNMQDFHNSMKFKIYKCTIYHKAWPLPTKSKKDSSFICLRCLRDKNTIKKFSAQNNMILSEVPEWPELYAHFKSL